MGHMQEPVVLKSWADPMPLHEWMRAWAGMMETSDLIYKPGATHQFDFFLYQLPRAFLHTSKDVERYRELRNDGWPRVVSEHRSKSVPLPVVQYQLPSYAVEMKIRDNFHDYKISVNSIRPVEINPDGLWDPDSDYLLNPVYFEGFSEDWVFPRYGQSDKKKFSLQVRSEHEAWTFVFLLRRALGGS